MPRFRFPAWACGLLALAFALPLAAANTQTAGDLVVHYNAVPTTTLAPDIARNYGITRSANRALVNIAVRQGKPGADRAVSAQVTLAVTNLSGQRSRLRVREVREGDAIYYLAEAHHSGTDTLNFEAQVTVAGKPGPISVSFRQEFFAQ